MDPPPPAILLRARDAQRLGLTGLTDVPTVRNVTDRLLHETKAEWRAKSLPGRRGFESVHEKPSVQVRGSGCQSEAVGCHPRAL